MKLLLLIIAIFCFVTHTEKALADDVQVANDRMWRGGIHAGISPYTGILGAEILRGPVGISIGLPTTISIRYYADDDGKSWFYGLHRIHYILNESKTKDGIKYDRLENTSIGAGFGYRYRWLEHLDLTLSASFTQGKIKFSNQTTTRTDRDIYIFPGISFGYTF